VTLRHNGRLRHLIVGLPLPVGAVAMPVDGPDIGLIGLDGSPLRCLVVLDPTKDFRPMP
jgi:hypothetical protein